MRSFWFSLKLGGTATACFALLLLATPAQAQNDSDSDRDESRSSARRESRSSGTMRDENNRSRQSSQSSRQQGRATLGVVLYSDNSNPLEIRRVLPNSAAENAGLERGDEILSINGRRVSSVDQLKRAVARAGGDEEFEIGILRDGRKQTVDASLSARRFARSRGGRQWQGNEGQYRNQQYGQMRDYDDQAYRGPYGDEGDNWRGERFANRGQMYGDDYGPADGRGYGRDSRRGGYWEDDERYEQDERYTGGYRGDEQGDRAFLGIALDEHDRDAVRVSGVYPESPAEDAGIRRGDEIVAIDDEEVESIHDLQHLLSQKDPDDDVTISVERNGRERTLHATLASQQEVAEASRDSYRMGRRNSYQGNAGQRGGYQDGYSENRRSQREDSRDYENDEY